jgi:hypothetical protein
VDQEKRRLLPIAHQADRYFCSFNLEPHQFRFLITHRSFDKKENSRRQSTAFRQEWKTLVWGSPNCSRFGALPPYAERPHAGIGVEPIYEDNEDREAFLRTLAEVVERFN